MKNKKKSDGDVLKRFMKEFFSYTELRKIGFFTKEMRGDFEAQAKRVCEFFGYKTVFEYRSKEIRCHISYGHGRLGIDTNRPLHIDDNGDLIEEPFITLIKSIYD